MSLAMSSLVGFLACVLVFLPTCWTLDNGLARLPMMGWNTWNTFACHIHETLIHETVQSLEDLGLKDAGYTYVNLDDCWAEMERLPDGRLGADKNKFPSGMKALGDFVHSRGFQFGIYSSAGRTTCAGYPASLGNEMIDAESFASWGVDYLKYDNCGTDAADRDLPERYTAMGNALNATGRAIVYSICEWGLQNPWEWAPKIGNAWRTTFDIAPYWTFMTSNLDQTVGLAPYASPGAWNDPDMLEVGVNPEVFTPPMQRSHFAIWSLLKSPLIIGADLRKIPAESLEILKAKEVIAFNQDPLGVAGDRVAKEGNKEVFAVPLVGGARGVVLFNRNRRPVTITLKWAMIGYPNGTEATIRDAYQQADLGEFDSSFSAEVGGFDCLALRVQALSPWDDIDEWRPWHVEEPARIQTRKWKGTRHWRKIQRQFRTQRSKLQAYMRDAVQRIRSQPLLPF